jgi:hypothetical protein
MTNIERIELAAKHLRDAARRLDTPEYAKWSDEVLGIANQVDCEIRYQRDLKLRQLRDPETETE